MKIEALRKKVDHLDSKLLRILFRRFQVTKKIGQVKEKNQLPLEDQSREALKLDFLSRRAKSLNMSPEFAQKLFKEIFSESKNQQKAQKK